MRIERRAFELRAPADAKTKSGKLVGHAAVFESEYDNGYFIETIARGAFAESIGKDDIRALWNHDECDVLGRNKAGTLSLEEDDIGLAVEIDPPDTQVGRDAVTLINRGDVSQMSFGFIVTSQKWETKADREYRTILKVTLIEVSPVTFPAYEATDISARSAREVYETRPTSASPLAATFAAQVRARELEITQQEA